MSLFWNCHNLKNILTDFSCWPSGHVLLRKVHHHGRVSECGQLLAVVVLERCRHTGRRNHPNGNAQWKWYEISLFLKLQNVSFYHQEIMINEHLKIFEIKSNSSFSRWLRKRLSPDSPKRLFILYGQPDSTADPNLAVDEQPSSQRQLSRPSRRHLHVHRPLSGRT
jgi:hypothetical protein